MHQFQGHKPRIHMPVKAYLVTKDFLFRIILKVTITLESAFNEFSEFGLEMSKVIDEVMDSET